MTKIQVILLFGKLDMFNAAAQENILSIVREEYCKIFSAASNDVQTILCEGTVHSQKKYDVVLDISGGKRVLNEGTLLDYLRKHVSARLYKIFPKWMGFNGKVGTRTGEPLPLPPTDKKSPDNDESPRIYVAEEPHENFERLQLPQKTLEEILRAINRIELEREVFEEWGLYAIMPNPICALNFFGPPGTGKTLAADALANKLGKKIIRASYADIESKYHGEGPKNVQAIFKTATEQDALLFIDEADSLLSKRLTNVTQGSEQAINSMRSQILICLEKFHGIVIFASNLVVNYDRAFASRLTSIKFDLPDEEMREKIWRVHLLPTDNAKVKLKIPLANDIDIAALAKSYMLSGRYIRNAVVNACVEARSKNMPALTQAVLIAEIERELAGDDDLKNAEDHTAIKNSSKQILANMLQKTADNTPPKTLAELEGSNQTSTTTET